MAASQSSAAAQTPAFTPPTSTSTSTSTPFFPTSSYDTTLCLVPPRHLWPRVDGLRALYDKGYCDKGWPPHINLVYPFVSPDALGQVERLLQKAVACATISRRHHVDTYHGNNSSSNSEGGHGYGDRGSGEEEEEDSSSSRTTHHHGDDNDDNDQHRRNSSTHQEGQGQGRFRVRLDQVGTFTHRHGNHQTVYLCDGSPETRRRLQYLRAAVFSALLHPGHEKQQQQGGGESRDGYQMHMTIGQSHHGTTAGGGGGSDSPPLLLRDKASLIPVVEWDATELSILVREREREHGGGSSTTSSCMKLWGIISLVDQPGSAPGSGSGLGCTVLSGRAGGGGDGDGDGEGHQLSSPSSSYPGDGSLSRRPLAFYGERYSRGGPGDDDGDGDAIAAAPSAFTPRRPYVFSRAEGRWKLLSDDDNDNDNDDDRHHDDGNYGLNSRGKQVGSVSSTSPPLPPPPPSSSSTSPSLTVASYNVLGPFPSSCPPTTSKPGYRARFPILASTILNLEADVLALQEVTDDFLSYLLKAVEAVEAEAVATAMSNRRQGKKKTQPGRRCRYRYVTHGPPHQPDLDPLTNHLNVVVLSRVPFDWDYVPSLSTTTSLPSRRGRHSKKGSNIVIRLRRSGGTQSIDTTTNTTSIPPTIILVAAIHLSSGVTDEAVIRKDRELRAVLRHLDAANSGQHHPRQRPCCIVAGDFNIPSTSSTSMCILDDDDDDASRATTGISDKSADMLARLEDMLLLPGKTNAKRNKEDTDENEETDDGGGGELGFVDTWAATRVRHRGDHDYDYNDDGVDDRSSSSRKISEEKGGAEASEVGATYDPLTNELAAESITLSRRWRRVGGSRQQVIDGEEDDKKNVMLLLRPQRYDRILVRDGSGLRLEVSRFGLFGRTRGVVHGHDHDHDRPSSTTSSPIDGGEEEKDANDEAELEYHRHVGVSGYEDEHHDDNGGGLTTVPSPHTSSSPPPPKSIMSFGSDHWGVRCELKLLDAAAPVKAVNDDNDDGNDDALPIIPLKPAQASLAPVSRLASCLADRGAFPSDEDVLLRQSALDLLREVVLLLPPDARNADDGFAMVPVGSHGLGVWSPSTSDLDVLCIGPISPRLFFILAGQRLRRAAANANAAAVSSPSRSPGSVAGGRGRGIIKVLRRVNAASGTMLELDALGVRVDLQYCPSAAIAETWPRAMRLPPADPIFFALPAQTLAKLKPARDLHYMLRTVPDLAAFRLAHRFVRCWARQRGIYAARFGYLGGIQISILLTRVCKVLSHKGRSLSAPDLLTSFFAYYAHFDWRSESAFDPFFHGRKGHSGRPLSYVRTAREPMAILGFHAPALNTAHAASLPSVRTIADEFRRADQLLSCDGMTWPYFLGEDSRTSSAQSAAVGATEFLVSYKTYIKIDVQFWGTSVAKGSGFVGWLESRCVMLLVELSRRVPSIHARIWPARFVNEDVSSEAECDKDFQGCYLVGLDKVEGADGSLAVSREDLKAAFGTLQSVLHKFEGQIRGDEKYYDSKCCWMGAGVANQGDLGDLRLDTREWGEHTIGEDESEDEEEDEQDLDLNQDADDDGGANPTQKKKRSASDKPLPQQRPPYQGKFRSSADVINRLRWDPEMDSSDYVVGYEDRFLGAKERALDLWKSEQTDDEFIPQHRILYFKRKTDGAVVWDRRERIDGVFGSGVQSQSRTVQDGASC